MHIWMWRRQSGNSSWGKVEDMTHTVLFCLTTHAECPSLAAGKGLATTSLVVDLPARPLVLWWAMQVLYYNQGNSWLGVRKSEFWTSRCIQCSWTEKQSSQTRGEINIFASWKSITTPSPGGLSSTIPALAQDLATDQQRIELES